MADTDVKELIVKLSLQNDQLKKELKNTNDAFKKNEDKSDSLKKSITSLKVGYIALAAAVGSAIAISKKFIDAALIQDKAQRTLAAAMKQAGTFTQEAFKHNLEYAQSLQKITTFGDEAIISVQKMLTNFGIEGKALDDLTKSTLDLAAAKGMDLTSAADLVAKSVGSSTNALSRYGIEIDGSVGSTERMQMAVENITKLFGGAAAAEANTYAGQMEQVKNIIGDLNEVVGFELLRNLNKSTVGLKEFIESDDAMEGLRKGVVVTIAVFKLLFETIKTNFKVLKIIFTPQIEAIKSIVMAFKMLTDDTIGWKEKLLSLKNIAFDTFKNIKDSIFDTAIGVKENYESIIKGTIDAYNNGQKILDDNFNSYSEKITEQAKLTAEQLKYIDDLRLSQIKENNDLQLQYEIDLLEKKRLEYLNYANELAIIDEAITGKKRKQSLERLKIASQYTDIVSDLGKSVFMIESNFNERMYKDEKTLARKKAEIAFKSAIFDKGINIFKTIVETARAVTQSLPNIPLATLVGISGGLQTAGILSTPLPEMPSFAQGGIIKNVVPASEDGMIAVQRGEAVLNKNAVVNLGEDTINRLNRGEIGNTVHITVQTNNGRAVIDTLNDYYKTYGGGRSSRMG